MKEIKFRGKRKDNGEWVCGYYVYCRHHAYILPIHNEDDPDPCFDERWIQKGADDESGWFEVIPETVGQFTGLKDKNEREIYRSDQVVEIFRDCFENSDRIPEDCQGRCRQEDIYAGVVVWFDSGWFLKTKEHGCISLTDGSDELEVIGNAHENPELPTD